MTELKGIRDTHEKGAVKRKKDQLFITAHQAEQDLMREYAALGHHVSEIAVVMYGMLASAEYNIDSDTPIEEVEKMAMNEMMLRRFAGANITKLYGENVILASGATRAPPAYKPPAPAPEPEAAPELPELAVEPEFEPPIPRYAFGPSDEQVLHAVEKMAENGKIIVQRDTYVDKVEVRDSVLSNSNIGLDGKLEIKDATISRSVITGKGDVEIKDAVINKRKQIAGDEENAKQ